MDFELINNLTDKKFRLQAFSDYCEKRANNYQAMNSLFSSALEFIQVEEVQTRGGGDDIISVLPGDIMDRIRSLVSGAGLSIHSHIPTSKGFTANICDVLKGYLDNQVDIENNVEDVDMTTEWLDVYDARGENDPNPVKMSTLDLLDDFKSSLHSITALCAANDAMRQDKVADRITVFRDRMSTVFTNGFSDISNTGEFLKQVLMNSTDIESYLNSIQSLSGMQEQAEDDSEVVPEDTDIYEYTGASPSVALNFDGVLATVSTVWNIGCKAVAGIFTAIGDIASTLFKKAGVAIERIAVNPYDISETDGAYTVDGFQVQMKDTLVNFNHIVDYEEVDGYDVVNDFLTPMVGNWYKFNTIMSERLIKINSIDLDTYPGNIYLNITSLVKIKPLSVANCYTILSALNEYDDPLNHRFNIANIENLTPLIKTWTHVHANTKDPEHDLAESFCATWLVDQIVWYCVCRSRTPYTTSIPMDSEENFMAYIKSLLPGTITNLDFVKLVSGYDPDAVTDEGTFKPFPVMFDFNSIYGSTHDYFIEDYHLSPLYCLVVQHALEKTDPVDFPFLAYRNTVAGFDESRFSIKTDSENQEAFTKFLTTAVGVVIVATIAITSFVLIKRAVRARRMKWIQKIGQMDNAMWNYKMGEKGHALDPKQMKQYFKLQRRLGASDAVGAGILSAISAAQSIKENVTPKGSLETYIARLITGDSY